MIDAARKAARGLARDFGEVTELQVSKKGAGDFVTNADLKAEQTLFEILSKARPGYSFLGEERGMVEGTDKTHTWIVDPLDGTTNFMHAIPHFAVNIALQREGEVVAGVTYNPITHDLFWVEKGRGAFLGAEKRLRVAARKHLDESVLATGVPFVGKPGHGQFLKELHQVSQKVAGVRRFGAASLDLAWVAAGRFDAYWERNLKPWDVAAGVLMVQESGGKVTTIEEHGDPVQGASILASNPELHPQVLKALQAAG
ncbi:inositol monophosphatase [Caulobacter zeae]|jgi:myo-inositol-1(or 4)-monophosphatase|uniref:Inositol-1-monophosphatase n=3 Tax=Caulobacteraceae TaxID=76892 RepID=A0A2T9JRE7_9CAUL|nr:inositol monophosphatase [Caulobacter zeae]PVM80913.1 inositol monophosphatase [Caulobacter radicis]PVM86285.1 inositol monophosphatase [Caulobacter radicis]